ncbi:mitogen-activated protein kinase 15-like protein isoform X2 [Tanacetum coccineum]
MNHQTSIVPQVILQVAYQSPQAPTQLMTKSPFVDSGFAVLVFSPGDDPIACLNKAMAFLTVVASSRFPSTNNQLRTSSNLRNQATIQDGRVTVQQVQGRQGQNYSGNTYKGNATSSRGNTTSGQARVVKCYNCQGEGHMARQCTQPKRTRNAAWYKEKAMLAEAQEAGQILDEEQLAFLADPGIPASQAQTVIPHNAAFQTEDLDTYDSDCDDLSTAQAVLMANISNYGSDVISEVPNSETYLNDMDNQSVHALQDFEQSPVMDFTDNEISSDSNIIPYSQYLQETQQATVQDTNLQAQQDSMILSVIEQIDVHSELPKVGLVNANLKKLKFHLTQFDSVVKKRTTPNALEEGEWGFEHTKTIFNNEIIPFLKSLKDIFNVFDKDLLNEITEVQTVFDQMETAVQLFSVDKQCLEITKKEILLENDRLLQKIMFQDVLLTVMNSISLNNDYVNMEMKKYDSCEKCLNLVAELSKSKQAYNDLLKNHSQLEQHSQLQDKGTAICKLKDTIKSLGKNTKDENVAHDKCEFEPIHKELENSVAKLIYENERLCNEINHVKQIFKDQFDSIKQTRVRHKEHSDSLINKLNLKSVENEDLKAQIQDKVFVITSLKNDLRKLKGKEIIENVVHTPSATTIAPGMFKLDLEPLPPSELDLTFAKKVMPNPMMNNVKKVRSEEPSKNKVDRRPLTRKDGIIVNRVVNPVCDVDVKHSLSKANSEILCATCNNSMFDGVHDKCLLDLVQNENKPLEAVAPRAEVLADSPVSTSIDQDAPSTSIPSLQEHEHSPIIS